MKMWIATRNLMIVVVAGPQSAYCRTATAGHYSQDSNGFDKVL